MLVLVFCLDPPKSLGFEGGAESVVSEEGGCKPLLLQIDLSGPGPDTGSVSVCLELPEVRARPEWAEMAVH
jgi:hypothetical protein